MSIDRLRTVISAIEYQLNVLKENLNERNEEIKQSVDEAYQRGYDKDYADKTNNDEVGKELAKDIYQRGLDDGRNETWEVARKIVLSPDEGGMSSPTLFTIFGHGSMQKFYNERVNRNRTNIRI